MFNVLLVEDDIHELENVCSCGIWSDGEFALIATATNGRDAWEILQKEKIDIVVTDIVIPIIDGLALCNLIRNAFPNVKIIILSGFGDFHYARQALGLGVNEYLLKPFKPLDLLDAIKKLVVKLNQEMQINKEILDYHLQIKNDLKYQRRVFLENLSFGIIPDERLKSQEKKLDLNLDFQSVCCVIVSFYEDKIFIDDLEYFMIHKIQHIIEKALNKQDIISFNLHHREYYIIFKNPQYEIIKGLLKKVKINVLKIQSPSQATNCYKIAMGGIKHKISGIAESFADARFLLNFHHMVANEDLLFMDEVLPYIQLVYKSDLGIGNEIELITKTLKFGTQSDIVVIIENLAKLLQSGNYSLIFFQNMCIKVTSIISQFLDIIDEDVDELLLDQKAVGVALLSESWQEWFSNIPAFKQYLIATLCAIMDIRDKKKRYKYNEVILKSKKYIDENYQNPNIRLTEVASYININPSYFSTLFTQEIGESFIEYLTGLRIEKAKLLLQTTSMRTVDVAFDVGFSDSNYFSTIFKKITGETPRSYKNIKDSLEL